MKYLLFLLVVVLSSCAQKVKYKPEQIVFYRLIETRQGLKSTQMFLLCHRYYEDSDFARPILYNRDDKHIKHFAETQDMLDGGRTSLFFDVPCIDWVQFTGVKAGKDIRKIHLHGSETTSHIPNVVVTNTHTEVLKLSGFQEVAMTASEIYEWYKRDPASFREAFTNEGVANIYWNEDFVSHVSLNINQDVSLFEYKQFYSVVYDWIWIAPGEESDFSLYEYEAEEEEEIADKSIVKD